MKSNLQNSKYVIKSKSSRAITIIVLFLQVWFGFSFILARSLLYCLAFKKFRELAASNGWDSDDL